MTHGLQLTMLLLAHVVSFFSSTELLVMSLALENDALFNFSSLNGPLRTEEQIFSKFFTDN